MIAALKRFFATDPAREQAHDVYLRVVAQARKPFFYADWQVPDTLDGRFDMILLHLFLVIARLEQRADARATDFIRALSEVFFADMDRSLREMGASDTGVGIRVKNMAQAFYGRLKSYSETIGDTTALQQALHRNVYRKAPVQPASLTRLAAYLQHNYQALQACDADEVMTQGPVFRD